MKKNVGRADTIARVLLSIIIGALGLYFQSWWGLLGLLPLLTGLFNFCPLYAILGINTRSRKTA